MRPRRLTAGLVLAGTAALWLRFNAAPPAHGRQFPHDLIDAFVPLTEQIGARLAQGELPLWNPYGCAGIPQLATLQMAVFHPVTWLAAFFPAEQVLAWGMLGHCALGGLLAGALFSRWGAAPLAAAAGALVFVFGAMLGQTFWPNEVATIAWLPGVLLCIDALARRWQWRWWLALAAATAIQLLAGFPQFALYTAYLALAYAVAATLRHAAGPRAAARRLAGIGAAALLGVGLAGVQLGPTLELVGQGERAAGIDVAETHYLPGVTRSHARFYANLLDPSPKLRSFDFSDGAGYVGIPALLLAAFALASARMRRRAAALALAGAAGLLLAEGLIGPTRWIWELYAATPGAAWFRTPERFRLLFFFAASGLVALGFDAAWRGDEPPRARRVALGAAAAAALCIALLGPLGAGLRAALALALLAVLVRAPGPARRGAALALFALLLADLALATGPFGSLRAPPGAWSRRYHAQGVTLLEGDAVARLRDELGVARVALRGMRPLIGAAPVDGLQRLACYEPLAPAPWPELSRRLGADALPGQLFHRLDPEAGATLYDIAGVRAVLSARGDQVHNIGLWKARWEGRLGPPVPAPAEGFDVARLDNPDALPRAYLVSDFAVVGLAAALEHVVRGDFDPWHRVLLDRDPGLAPQRDAPLARAARILRYAPERVEIEVDAARAGLLVLSDTHYPGWHARVDGRPAPVLRANALFRAVPVESGLHRVVFEYEPGSLRAGALVSAISALVLAATPWLARTRARRAGPSR